MSQKFPEPGTAGIPAGPEPNAPGTTGTPAGPETNAPGTAGIPAGPEPNAPGTAGIPAGLKTNAHPMDWYSRGYLPHLDQPGLIQSINFRLQDAVPVRLVDEWKEELRWAEGLAQDDRRAVALRAHILKYEDAGHGSCWLRDHRIAALVESALLFFDEQRYRLLAWCVMPNHVHVLIETWPGHRLDKVLHSWKSFAAHEANKILGRKGAFWARDYYDRFMRDERHFVRMITYIEDNPVQAGLAPSAEAWPFGSARRKAKGG